MKRSLLVGLLLLTTGCATIIEGTRQDIAVITTPPGATCTYVSDGLTLGQVSPTPGSLNIRKSKNSIKITCEKPGYQTVTLVNRADVAGWVAGNLIVGGLIGLIVDVATDADRKYDTRVSLTLPPNAAPGLGYTPPPVGVAPVGKPIM